MIKTIQETRFASGLTILTDKMPGVRSVTLGFFFRVGSRNEPENLNGISHFIEHSVFKGTERRSALDIAIEQDRLGGNLDAYTTHEETGFAIKVLDENLPAGFDLIADMLSNPRFDDADLKAEQRVVIEEMKMIEDSPEEYLGEVFSEALFPNHPLGRSIAGTAKSVRTFNNKSVSSYFNSVFTDPNLVITAAGNVDHQQIVNLAAKYEFSAKGTDSPTSKSDRVETAPCLAAPFLIKNNPNLEQVHLVIATPLVGAIDKRRYAADILTSILGDGASSRLWQKVREQRGLAYSVGASAAMYLDCGVFSIFAGTSPKHVSKVVDLSVKEMRSIVKSGVTGDEINLAKLQARTSILLSLEDSASRAASLAQSEMLHGRQIPVEETLANIDAVTNQDLQSLAEECFSQKQIAFAALGDLKNVKISSKKFTT